VLRHRESDPESFYLELLAHSRLVNECLQIGAAARTYAERNLDSSILAARLWGAAIRDQ